MSLTAHRPARSVSSLVADDPVELAADLPRLPYGATLDPDVLRDAACGEDDLELFYPEPGDAAAEQAAKQVCAGCPVQQPCLEMALATGDQHAILGGTTPAERGRLRRQRQVTHARQQAAQRATAATGIDPAEVRGPVGRSMAAHLRGDASATVRAWELCKTAGTAHVARMIGVHVTDLHAALAHWGLEVPRLRQPAELVHDPVAAREAFGLVEQVGWVKAAEQMGAARRTLRAAFQRWGMGEPVHRGPRATSRLAVDRAAAEAALELAVRVGVNRAAERFGVNRATLYNAWRQWGLGRPTDREDGARLARERVLAARVVPGPDHPWRRDRSIWQPRRTADRTAGPERTGERTAGRER
jgi:WhiB family transcriptional regulator, redox-sensing transcriptional regulator